MAIDFAGDILLILGDTGDFTKTTLTYTQGSLSQSVEGLLAFEQSDKGEERRDLDRETAIFLIADTEWSTVPAAAPGDTLGTWDVDAVRVRRSFTTLEISRRKARAT